MLSRLLGDAFRGWKLPWRAAGSRAARDKVCQAVACCAAGRFDDARLLCEVALSFEANCADASYVLGIVACHGGAPEEGGRAIGRALATAPRDPYYLAAAADAELLQQHADVALAAYARAFPRHAAGIAGLTDAGMLWKRAHPDWTARMQRVTLPLAFFRADAREEALFPVDDVTSGHLLNWALVLISQRRGHQAMHLMQQALLLNPRLGYAQSALALLCTLNRDWEPALAAARTARTLAVEVFSGVNDLCILAAQFGNGTPYLELEPVFDWAPFIAPDGDGEGNGSGHLDLLPRVEGGPHPQFPAETLVYYIACDPRYFLEYGIALACSIRDTGDRDAIHFHIYNPTPELWSALDELRSRITPLAVSVTWESVDFDRFGGKSHYCIFARFSRLYALMREATPGLRVVMVDADSLVRGALGPALAGGREVGLVQAAHEPPWHQYPAGSRRFGPRPRLSGCSMN